MLRKHSIFVLCWILCFSIVMGCSTESETQTSIEPNSKGWPRTIENADGTTVKLKKKPEKIAVLHFGYSEYLFALGVAPIATTDIHMPKKFETLKPYQKEVSKMEDLGDSMSPNLEKLVQLQPDLIIAGSFQEKILDQLRKIAPVVIDKRDYQGLGWKETLQYYAKIVGEEEKAKQYIQKTEQTITDARKQFDKYHDKTFVFLRPQSKGSFGIVGSKGFEYYHEEGFGLKTPKDYPKEWKAVSLEGIAKLNPDYIFFQDDLKRSQEAVKQAEKDQVWKNMEAVKNGHVYYLDVSLNTGSPLAVELAAKTIKEKLENQK